MINVVEIFGGIVAEVQKKWDSQAVSPEKPYYMHGSFNEIVNTLVEKDRGRLSKFSKYPAIILPQPFISKETESGCEATLTIVIVALSKRELKADDRYSYTFNPTLFPIMDILKDEINHSRSINETNVLFEWSEHPYWKTDGTANMANDYIDAIEIQNLKLNFLKHC